MGVENERVRLPANTTDTRRPEKRGSFITQRKNDQPLLLANDDPMLCDLTRNWSSYEGDNLFGEWLNDEGLSQVGRGENRPAEDNGAELNSEVSHTNFFNVDIIHVERPVGDTGVRRSEIKRTIVCIKNTDEMCLAGALVVAMAKIENHGPNCCTKV